MNYCVLCSSEFSDEREANICERCALFLKEKIDEIEVEVEFNSNSKERKYSEVEEREKANERWARNPHNAP